MKKFFQKLFCESFGHQWEDTMDCPLPGAKQFYFKRCKVCRKTNQTIIELIEYRIAKAEEAMILELSKSFIEGKL
jgi:hypothetical protein